MYTFILQMTMDHIKNTDSQHVGLKTSYLLWILIFLHLAPSRRYKHSISMMIGLCDSYTSFITLVSWDNGEVVHTGSISNP